MQSNDLSCSFGTVGIKFDMKTYPGATKFLSQNDVIIDNILETLFMVWQQIVCFHIKSTAHLFLWIGHTRRYTSNAGI